MSDQQGPEYLNDEDLLRLAGLNEVQPHDQHDPVVPLDTRAVAPEMLATTDLRELELEDDIQRARERRDG